MDKNILLHFEVQYVRIAAMSSTTSSMRHGAVLIADVEASSDVGDFRGIRDRNLSSLSRMHLDKRWIARPYTVTAWDEFQTVSWDWQRLPRILFDIRQVFAPWNLYVGVGYGGVSGWRSKKPINEALSGEGFERARAAIDKLKSGKGEKFRRLSQFDTGDRDTDDLLNLIYALHDTLIQQVSARQWEMIAAVSKATSQEAVAGELGVAPSTVTRNLKRGHYWQLRKTLAVITEQMAQGRLARDRTMS